MLINILLALLWLAGGILVAMGLFGLYLANEGDEK